MWGLLNVIASLQDVSQWPLSPNLHAPNWYPHFEGRLDFVLSSNKLNAIEVIVYYFQDLVIKDSWFYLIISLSLSLSLSLSSSSSSLALKEASYQVEQPHGEAHVEKNWGLWANSQWVTEVFQQPPVWAWKWMVQSIKPWDDYSSGQQLDCIVVRPWARLTQLRQPGSLIHRNCAKINVCCFKLPGISIVT